VHFFSARWSRESNEFLEGTDSCDSRLFEENLILEGNLRSIMQDKSTAGTMALALTSGVL